MKNKTFSKLMIPTILISLLTSCGITPTRDKDEFDIVKDNYVEMIEENTSTKAYEDKTIEQIKNQLLSKRIKDRDTYYFNDIDYVSDQERSSWPAGAHLSRTKAIAILAKKRNDNNLKEIALKLLYHWVYSNYRNVNWWQNEIGANGNLSDIAILLFDDLDTQGKDALRGKLWESSLYHRPQLKTHEGSNLINYLNMTLKSSTIDKNKEELKVFQTELPRIIELSTDKVEGFKEDGTFFQHGRQIQTGSYGLEGVGNIGKLIRATSKTSICDTIDETKLNIIYKFATEGLASITHKGMFNYMGIGRSYSRVNAIDTTKTTGFKELEYFSKLSKFPNKEKYNKLIDDIKNKNSSFEGVKNLPVGKLISVNDNGVYMSFKGATNLSTNSECVNQENELGYNLSSANNTCVMETGNEYYNISPVWDYSFLPGATSPEFNNDQAIYTYVSNPLFLNSILTNKLPLIHNGEKSVFNFSSNEELETNGVSYSMCKSYKDILRKDGIYIDNSGIKFAITCFATKEGMAIIGSDFKIQTTNKDILVNLAQKSGNEVPLKTTIEQNIVNEGFEPSESGDHKSVCNGSNVVYSSLIDTDVLNLTVKNQSGTWQRNNPQLKSPSDVISKRVMTITYDSKGSDNAYAYSIQNKKRIENNETFKLMSNDSKVHAVELPNGKIAACFYDKDGKFGPSDKYKLDTSSKEYNEFDESKGLFKIFEK